MLGSNELDSESDVTVAVLLIANIISGTLPMSRAIVRRWWVVCYCGLSNFLVGVLDVSPVLGIKYTYTFWGARLP